MKLFIIGQAWGRVLADGLRQQIQGEADITFVDTSRSLLRRLAAMPRHCIIVRVGLRPGAKSWRGRIFDSLIWIVGHLKAAQGTVYYWIGTDVLNATQENWRPGRSIRGSLHLAAAPWLGAELRTLGISAVTAFFPGRNLLDAPAQLPSVFTVLSYVPDSRPAFYGGPIVAGLAQEFPTVRFLIVGGAGAWLPRAPANLEFLGWQNDMASIYQQTSVVIRLVQHDALGATVREGLCLARHIMYSYKFPHTIHVPFDDPTAASASLARLVEEFKAGLLELNMAGRDYVLKNLKPEDQQKQVLAEIRQWLETKRGTVVA